MSEFYRLTDHVSGSIWGSKPPERKVKTMGCMADLDVFIKQHCKDNLALEVVLTSEISDHLDGKIRYEFLSSDAKDILDAWQVYCGEIDKKIAR